MLEVIEDGRSYSDTCERFVRYASSIAGVTAAAYLFASEALGATDAEMSYAKAVLISMLNTDTDNVKVIVGDTALMPGGVKETFVALDKWFSTLESDVLPEKAQHLLDNFSSSVDEATIDHWMMLSTKKKRS